MRKFKRWLPFVTQIVVVLSTVVATVIIFLHPNCITLLLTDIARGLGGGVLLAGVKVLSRLGRSGLVCRPLRCWWCYGWAVAKCEFRFGLVSGYLLGVVLALWECLNMP